ncbi:MAG: hypothetical protein ABIK26_03165 [Candidatus Omnitrophota bacterium]
MPSRIDPEALLKNVARDFSDIQARGTMPKVNYTKPDALHRESLID